MLTIGRLTGFVSVLFSAAVTSMACGVAWWSFARADSATGKNYAVSRRWAIVRVELPTNDEPFPPGIGADIASSQCLICHSSGMVLTQPPLKKDEWRAEITKMRTAYGAPIPEDQVDALSEYLKNIGARDR
jgi:mono/diheme cytochrome c family protein